MLKIYIETYGCSANKSDTEIMMGLLKNEGYEFIDSPEKADVLIINTCVVKTPTANRMVRRIRELYSLNKPLIVAGCMAEAETRLVEKLAPKASLIGPNAVAKIATVVEEATRGKKLIVLDDFSEKPDLPHVSLNPIISIVQISSGCLLKCSYCEAKLARGALRSFSEESILKRIREDVLNGAKEVWITSQDNGCYGFDIGTNLAKLLNKIASLDCDFLVRVGMMNPLYLKSFLPELLNAYESEKIFKFFHIPVQSGSEEVLNDMRRGYKAEDFIKIVEQIRKKFPLATISTDIIVGYPTEKDDDFKKTVELIEATKPDIVNISKFSARPGTEAFKLKPLPASIVSERSKYLHSLVKQISEERNKRWLNWEGKAIVDEKNEKGYMARNFAYKPIILKKARFGSIVNVRIVGYTSSFLIGKVIKEH